MENQHSYMCGDTPPPHPPSLNTFLFETKQEMIRSICTPLNSPCLSLQEDYTTDEEALAAHGVKGGAGGILDLLKASKQVAGLDSATLRYQPLSSNW